VRGRCESRSACRSYGLLTARVRVCGLGWALRAVANHLAGPGLPRVPCYSSDARGIAPPCECAKQCDRHGLSQHTTACLMPTAQLRNRTDWALFQVRGSVAMACSVP
jgi:hypothetical protein